MKASHLFFVLTLDRDDRGRDRGFEDAGHLGDFLPQEGSCRHQLLATVVGALDHLEHDSDPRDVVPHESGAEDEWGRVLPDKGNARSQDDPGASTPCLGEAGGDEFHLAIEPKHVRVAFARVDAERVRFVQYEHATVLVLQVHHLVKRCEESGDAVQRLDEDDAGAVGLDVGLELFHVVVRVEMDLGASIPEACMEGSVEAAVDVKDGVFIANGMHKPDVSDVTGLGEHAFLPKILAQFPLEDVMNVVLGDVAGGHENVAARRRPLKILDLAAEDIFVVGDAEVVVVADENGVGGGVGVDVVLYHAVAGFGASGEVVVTSASILQDKSR